jgi:hypothetical protein
MHLFNMYLISLSVHPYIYCIYYCTHTTTCIYIHTSYIHVSPAYLFYPSSWLQTIPQMAQRCSVLAFEIIGKISRRYELGVSQTTFAVSLSFTSFYVASSLYYAVFTYFSALDSCLQSLFFNTGLSWHGYLNT